MEKNRIVRVLLPIVVMIAIIIAVSLFWEHKKMFPSTDDAYVGANIINIAPQISGRVIEVNTKENQYVSKGALLFRVDPKPFQLAISKANVSIQRIEEQIKAQDMVVNAARAKLHEAKAELANAQAMQRRTAALVKKGFLSQAAGDNSNKDLQVALSNVVAAKNQFLQAYHQRGAKGDKNANLRAARIALAQAKLNFAYTEVRAPQAGYIQNCSLHEGATVAAFSPVFALVESTPWWIDADFKETQFSRLRVGQPVAIVLDIYPDHVFHGSIQSFSSSSRSSFSLLPAENASGNWVKVTQRFPVRIEVNEAPQKRFPLRVGASAKVTVDTEGA